MNFDVEKRRIMMDKLIHYQQIHMAGVIRDRILQIETELEASNAKLRDYIRSTTESTGAKINIDLVSGMIHMINEQRLSYLTLKNMCSRIFFDVSQDNWHLIGVMTDMIAPFKPAETVDTDYIEGRTTHETLYEVMIRLKKIKPRDIITRNFTNLTEISCSNHTVSSESFNTFKKLLQSMIYIAHNSNFWDTIENDRMEFANPCPQRCIQGMKGLPQSELIFQINLAGWILLGMFVPVIQDEFIKTVNEISHDGVLNILGFDINAKVIHIEELTDGDIDPIDLEPFVVGEDIFLLNCSHKLKTQSLLGLVQSHIGGYSYVSSIRCPICRENIAMRGYF